MSPPRTDTGEPRNEPVDIIGDVLCRTSFGDFSEQRLRKVAAQIVGVLHREGFYIASETAPSSKKVAQPADAHPADPEAT